MRPALWLLALPVAALYASTAQAAETGDMRGRVLDENGAPVVGAVIQVSGPNLPGVREGTTDKAGYFTFFNLPVGAHEVLISSDDHGPVRMLATVRLGETAFIPVSVSTSQIQEVVIIEADQPIIDTSSSSISTELTGDFLQNLPVARTFQQAVQMLPGVYGRVDTISGDPGTGNPSVRGEGAYGNNYYVDGITTRDPATKTFGTGVQFDAIKSVQVYTDGAPAEFGQATGMMVNVVTKDGGDEHHGTVAYYLSTHASGGQYGILDVEQAEEVLAEKRKFLSQEVALTAGGPIIKEKLWYFVAMQGNLGWTRFEGQPVPTNPPCGETFDLSTGMSDGGLGCQKNRAIQGFGKLTWFVTPDLTFQYQLNSSGSNTRNRISNPLVAPEAQEQINSFGFNHIFTAKWRPIPTGELQFKATYVPININAVPQVGEQKDIRFQNASTGQIFGNSDSFDYNRRTRLGGQLEYTQLLNAGGSHRIKTGVEYWSLRDQRELVFTGGEGTVPGPFMLQGQEVYPEGYDFGGISYLTDPANGLPCDQDLDGDGILDNCYGFTTYQNVGPLGHRGSVFGFYIQDDYRPIPQLTINAGFRFDTETLFQNTGMKVVDAFMPAPRVGVAWDATNDGKTLVSANYGRYFDVAGNTFADWADTRSAFVFGTFRNSPDGYFATNIQDPVANPLVYCTDASLDDYVTHLIDDYGYEADEAAAERGVAEEVCGPRGLRPYHMDKVSVVVEREIIPHFSIGLRGIWSQTVNLPEDIDINLDTWVIANTPAKRRDYRAIEVMLKKNFHKRWAAFASYTLSESKGHMPGQFELASGGNTGSDGNNVGVYLDDIYDPDTRAFFYDNGFGWLLDGLAGLGTPSDTAGYYGYLPYHSFHQVKVNGFYTFDFGTTLGVVYEFNSGRAWQRRGFVPLYGDYFSFPEGRGTRFMPAVHYIDFRIGHRLQLANNQTVELNLDLFNMPDLRTPVTYYENDNESFGKTLFRQAPRSVRIGAKYTF